MGNNGLPQNRFPLGRCEGDCDNDKECGPGLICFHRNNNEPVPGCEGGLSDKSRSDYCIPEDATSYHSGGHTPQSPVPAPTPYHGLTMNGDYDMTKPSSPPPPPPAPTPGMEPGSLEVQVVAKNNVPPEYYPLSECRGDCDEDKDCADGLICFHHDSNQAVPGCLGGEDDSSKSDYCIIDPNSSRYSATPDPTPSPTNPPTNPPTKQPTKQPTRAPTKAPTKAPVQAPRPNRWNRPTSPPIPVTIKVTGGNTYSRPNFVPTQPPFTIPTQPPVPIPTNPPTDPPTTPAPTKYPTPVPTPVIPYRNPTTEVPTKAPSPAPTPHQMTPYHDTRIRLYWEEGYTWQESTSEKFWCMMYDYRGKPGTGRCWHGEKVQPCSRDEVYIATCNNDKRQRFSIIWINLEEVLIKVARDNRCFQRNGYKIQLRECDAENDLQRWFSPRGAFFQRRFEIAPVSLSQYCTTQEHHPKHGEVVELVPCGVPRHPFHQSNFWQKW